MASSRDRCKTSRPLQSLAARADGVTRAERVGQYAALCRHHVIGCRVSAARCALGAEFARRYYCQCFELYTVNRKKCGSTFDIITLEKHA